MITEYDIKVSKRIKDIKDHPESHRHTFEELRSCCFVDGILDLQIMDAHEEFASVGKNAGLRCDVTSGPCSCGGWH